MDVAALRAQLYAIRAQVDAILLAIDAPPAPAPADEKCPHPASQRQDLSTMGGPTKWRCRLCGHEQVESDD